MRVTRYILCLVWIVISCKNETTGPSIINKPEKNQSMNISDNDSIAHILERLNWWYSQTLDEQGNPLEVGGEARTAITKYQKKLNELNIKYHLENNKYVISKD